MNNKKILSDEDEDSIYNKNIYTDDVEFEFVNETNENEGEF